MKLWYSIITLAAVFNISASQHLQVDVEPGESLTPSPISSRLRNKPTIVIEHSNFDEPAVPLQINLTSPQGSLKALADSPNTGSPAPTKALKILGIPEVASRLPSKASKILGIQSQDMDNEMQLSVRSPRRAALRRSAPLDFTNSDAAIRLMDDIGKGQFHNVKSAMEYGVVNINEPVASFDGQTPFERAIDLNKVDIVEYMVGHGADLARKNRFGQTPLEMAIENKLPTVAFYIAEKLNQDGVNQKTPSGKTILIEAIEHGYRDLAELLLKRQADKDAAADDGTTPLIAAAKAGNKDIVKLLITWNAKIDAHDKRGWTALMWAAKGDRRSIIRELEHAKANQNIQSYNTKTIIDMLYDENDKRSDDKKRTKQQIEAEALEFAGKTYREIKNDIKKIGEASGNSLRWLTGLLQRKGSQPTLATMFNDPASSSATQSKISPDHSPRTGSLTKASKILGEDVAIKAKSAPTSKISELLGIIPEQNSGVGADLMRLIDENNVNAVRAYLGHHLLDINEPVSGYAGQSPLYRAADKNRIEILEVMVNYKPQLDRKNEVTGMTPRELMLGHEAQALMQNIFKNNVSAAEDQIKNGLLDIDQVVPEYMMSPREYAMVLDRQEIVHCMAENTPTPPQSRSVSTRHSPESATRSIVKKHSDPEDAQRLMTALQNNDMKSVMDIVAKGTVDINAPVEGYLYQGQSPFYRSIEVSQNKIAKYLVEQGAKFDVTNNLSGKTPLDLIIEKYNRTEIAVPYIEGLAREKRIDEQNEFGETLLYRAVEHGNEDLVKLLLRVGASSNIPDQAGRTPLMMAAKSCHPAIMQLLIKEGADLNAQDQYGRTALMRAAERNKSTCVHMLLQAGANSQLKTKEPRKIIELLVEENDHLPIDKQTSDEDIQATARLWGNKTFFTINDALHERKSIFQSLVKNWKKAK